MEFTKEVPKTDGIYWIRRKEKKDTVVHVRNTSEGLVEFGAMVSWIGSDWSWSLCDLLDEFDCFWFGPILPPK